MYIYFDFYKGNGVTLIGVSGYENEYSFKPLMKKVEVVKEDYGYNQYHLSIKAFDLAVREIYSHMCKGNKVGNVIFLNQNDLIFSWLYKQNYSNNYKFVFSELERDLIKIVDSMTFEYKKIKGKENKAKDILKNEAILYENDGVSRLDFKKLKDKFASNGVEREVSNNSNNSNIVYVEKFNI